MHSNHIGVMLIGPGGDGPVRLAGEHRWLSSFECWQGGAVNHEQVGHSLSMAKADESNRLATKGENPATHRLNRSNAWRNLSQRHLAF